jgi:hypothetical protein
MKRDKARFLEESQNSPGHPFPLISETGGSQREAVSPIIPASGRISGSDPHHPFLVQLRDAAAERLDVLPDLLGLFLLVFILLR